MQRYYAVADSNWSIGMSPVREAPCLEWSTASESNNAWFIVERAPDGQSWNEIARVPGAGNGRQLSQYTYADETWPGGLQYFRLSQMDANGTAETFDVLPLECDGNSTDILIFPNPNTGRFSIKATGAKGPLDFTIYDVAGVLLRKGVMKKAPQKWTCPIMPTACTPWWYKATPAFRNTRW